MLQIRKSHSLRSPSTTFKPPLEGVGRGPGSGANPYAQPFRGGSRAKSASIPPIPDPDYSLSEGESDAEREKTVARVGGTVLAPSTVTEGSGGSSTSSGSLPHSFSVDEIQKVRTQLKSSKSYPNDFIPTEDGDNSSSGVSSDQEIPPQEQKVYVMIFALFYLAHLRADCCVYLHSMTMRRDYIAAYCNIFCTRLPAVEPTKPGCILNADCYYL